MEPKLLDRLRDRLRVKHYSIRTEQAYVDWVRRFVVFHGKRHPRDLGPAEVEAYLTDLAVKGRVSASTQNQAKSAILFLFREVINSELPWLDTIVAARKTQRLPVVLSLDEADKVLGRMRGMRHSFATPSAVGLRHPYCSGAARPSRREHEHRLKVE